MTPARRSIPLVPGFCALGGVWLLAAAAAAPALAQPCAGVDYTTYIRQVHALGTAGAAHGIAIAGAIAVVADGDSGVAIVDVGFPPDPVPRGRTDTPGVAQDVAITGVFAYVADGAAGLRVIDVSDPDAPVTRGGIDTPGTASGVAVVGTTALVADSFAGLRTIDVANPDAPVSVGSLVLPSHAFGVAVAGTVAFVAGGNGGLHAVDVTNPAAPVLLDTENTGGFARGVLVEGALAYVANSTMLTIVNVSSPSALSTVSSSPIPVEANRLVKRGSHVFVAGMGQGVASIDVANPAAPVVVGQVQTFGTAYGIGAFDIWLVVADGGHGLVTIEAFHPESPPILGGNATIPAIERVAAADAFVYAACGSLGLRVVSVEAIGDPVVVGALDTAGFARDVAVAGAVVYVADGAAGFAIVDVSAPGAPTLRGTLDTASAFAVTGSEEVAFLADGNSLLAIDVSNPDAPFVTGDIAFPTTAHDVVVRGDVAYVANFTEGVQVVDVSDPSALALITTIDTPDYSLAVDAAGSALYVGDAQYVLTVDVTNPSSPVIAGAVETADQIWALAAFDEHVYVANAVAGVQVLGVQDIHAPVLDGSVVTGNAQGIAVSPWSLDVMVGTSTDGLQVLGATCHSTGVGDGAPIAAHTGFRLAAYPNPFRDGTTIRFTLDRATPASLGVYDAAGRLVTRVTSGATRGPGEVRAFWDGTDASGRRVAPGAYFLRLEALGRVASRSIVRLR